MSPDMILTRAVNGKPMATPRPYFSGIEKKLHSGGFKGYVLLTVIYLGDRDELSQDYTHCVNWPTLGFQDKSSFFKVLCYIRYFVRE